MDRRLIALLSAIVIAVGVWFVHPSQVLANLTASGHVTLVYGRPTRLTVTRYDANGEIGRGTTSDRAIVSRIVHILNQADPPSPGSVACPAFSGRIAALRFYYNNGDTWTVSMSGCWFLSTHGELATALGDPAVYGPLPGLLDQVAGVVRSS